MLLRPVIGLLLVRLWLLPLVRLRLLPPVGLRVLPPVRLRPVVLARRRVRRRGLRVPDGVRLAGVRCAGAKAVAKEGLRRSWGDLFFGLVTSAGRGLQVSEGRLWLRDCHERKGWIHDLHAAMLLTNAASAPHGPGPWPWRPGLGACAG